MRRLSYAKVMATIAVVVAVGGGSFAIAQSSSRGTIKGCVSKKTGVMRVPAVNKKCRRGERIIRWNSEGRAGAPLVVTGFIADRLESGVEAPRVHVRACNVTDSVIESVQLNFRVMVLR